MMFLRLFFFFFFNDTATTEIYTLSLHDALPIFGGADDGPVDEDPFEGRLGHRGAAGVTTVGAGSGRAGPCPTVEACPSVAARSVEDGPDPADSCESDPGAPRGVVAEAAPGDHRAQGGGPGSSHVKEPAQTCHRGAGRTFVTEAPVFTGSC